MSSKRGKRAGKPVAKAARASAGAKAPETEGAQIRSRELVVVAAPPPHMAAHALALALPKSHANVAQIAAKLGCALTPVAGPAALSLASGGPGLAAAALPKTVGELARYFQVDAPENRLDSLAKKFREAPGIAAAYVMPVAELPARRPVSPPINAMRAQAAAPSAAAVTPDFTDRQLYFGAPPGGLGVAAARAHPGGDGTGVNIIDIEGAWTFMHEDLRVNMGGLLGGEMLNDVSWRNHGTAVIGIVGADQNRTGITGIAPGAFMRSVSAFSRSGLFSSQSRYTPERAIRQAADALHAGDIIIVELHSPGPSVQFQSNDQQRGFIAVEWWPATAAAVRYATSRGVIVVAAAGNGAEDLDAAIYDGPAAKYGFPSDWTNPFRRGAADTGAILIGAGAPPPGTHGADWGADRSRLDFSNFGAAVDAQGWGREVTSTGYGDLQGGRSDETRWYTNTFAGTSSATPVVVGALACVQGIRLARGQRPLTPLQARELLRATGSVQQAGTFAPATQRIGNRPDIGRMLAQMPA